MFEQFAIVGHQVIDLRAPARGEHQVVLVIVMERYVFVSQPKVRRICTHGRGVFGHVPNKRQRRIANYTGRCLVKRSPAGKNATLQLVLDNVQHVFSDMHRKEQQCPRLRRLSNKRTRGKRLGMVDAKRINPYVGIQTQKACARTTPMPSGRRPDNVGKHVC